MYNGNGIVYDIASRINDCNVILSWVKVESDIQRLVLNFNLIEWNGKEL